MISFVKNYSVESIKTNCLRISIIQILLATTLIVSFSGQAFAGQKSFVEITKSRKSETLDDIYTFGLYSGFFSDSSASLYGGMQFMFLERDNGDTSNTIYKIFIGQSFGEIFSPFYEIGTDLYGLLTLLDDDTDRRACTEEQKCAIDFFFRLGLRINLSKTLSIGIYHENIDFGDFHTSLSGEHQYVGSSIAFRF